MHPEHKSHSSTCSGSRLRTCVLYVGCNELEGDELRRVYGDGPRGDARQVAREACVWAHEAHEAELEPRRVLGGHAEPVKVHLRRAATLA